MRTLNPGARSQVGSGAPGTDASAPPTSWLDVRGLWGFMLLTSFLPSDLSWPEDRTELALTDGSWASRLPLIIMLGWSMWLWVRSPTRVWTPDWTVAPWLAALVGWVGLTLLWSPLPDASFKSWLRLVLTLLVATVLAHGYRGRMLDFLSDGLLVLMLVLVPSIAVALLKPGVGLESVAGIEGSWRGITAQKNTLGLAAALAAASYFVLLLTRPRDTLAKWWMAAVAVMCLLGSRSSTSLAMTVLISGIFWLFYRQHLNSFAWLSRLLLAFVLLAMTYIYLYFMWNSQLPTWNGFVGSIAQWFGKGSDLSGRTDIWPLVWAEIEKHPWMGLGYAAFWRGDGSPSQYIADLLYWAPTTAHNGYIDLINEVGLVGLLLFVALCVAQLARIASLHRRQRVEASVHLALLVPFLLWNFSETSAVNAYMPLQFVIWCSLLMAQTADHPRTASA